MNIWNTDVLASQLANDEIDQYQKTKYYIGSFYLQVIGTVLPIFILGLSYTITLVTFASFIVTSAVFHAGAIKVFQACASFKKASALDTLVVLGLPVCVKIHIGYWAAYVLITSLLNSMNGPMLLWVAYGFVTMPIMVWLQFFFIRRAVVKNYV